MPEIKVLEKRIGAKANQTPVVSVIIPAYNVAGFIAETLDAVFAQTYINYEIVLVNDGSPDTEELEKTLAPYFDKIVYIKQENGGTAAARNTAIKNSTGEFVAFLDGDDIWLPDYLEIQLDELKNSGGDLICADAEFFSESNLDNISSLDRRSPDGAPNTVNLINGKCTVITSGIVARRETVWQAGMFDEELPRIGIEDFDLWFRIAKAGNKIVYRNKILLKYRVRMNSLSGEIFQRINREIAACETIDRKYELNAEEKNALAESLRRCAAMLDLEKGKRSIAEKDFQNARNHFRAANTYYGKTKLSVLARMLQISPQTVYKIFKTLRPDEFAFVSPSEITETAEIQTLPEKPASLVKQSAWLLLAKVTGFILSSLLPILVVRYFTPDNVGLYRQAFQVVINAVAILPLGFSMSAFYFLNRQPEKRSAAIANILLFNFVMGGLACLTLFFYPQLLGDWIFRSEAMTQLAPLIGVVIWLWIISAFLEIVALANQETRLATVFIILAQLTKTVLMTGAVILFTTVEAFLYAALVQGVLQIIALLVYVNIKFPRFWKSFSVAFFREQAAYALPFGLVALLYTSQTDIHNYFVGHKFGEADFAIYSTGCFELPLIGMLYESFGAVLIPRMSELEAAGNKREMFLTTISVMNRLAQIYFPLFVFFMIVADQFITTLFTPVYAASVPIFRINILLLPFYCLMLDPIARAFPAIGKFLLKMRIVLFFCLIAALYFGLQFFDLRGMIAIVVAALFIEKIISGVKIARVLGVEKSDAGMLKTIGKTAFAAAFSGVGLLTFYLFAKDFVLEICLNLSRTVMAFFQSVSPSVKFERAADLFGGGLFLGVCLLLFAAIYFLAASYAGVISEDDKAGLANLLRKLTRQKKKLDLQLKTSD